MKVTNGFHGNVILFREFTDDHSGKRCFFPIIVILPLICRAHVEKEFSFLLKLVELVLHVAARREDHPGLLIRHTLEVVLHALLKHFGLACTEALKQEAPHLCHSPYALLLNLSCCLLRDKGLELAEQLLSLPLPAFHLPFNGPETVRVE